MNIRQLRYICAVARHDLNVSATAESLYTSQPGVSKQIRALEDELNVQIFERSGRQLTRITNAGETIIELANRVLIEVDTIKSAAQEFSDPGHGTLSIATTQTQARYTLPPILGAMHARYPQLAVSLHQGTPVQIARLLNDGVADVAIATEAMEHFGDLVMLPCYQWHRGIVVPHGHPLADAAPLTLAEIAKHPIVTYVFGFSGGSSLDSAFRAAHITPTVGLTATDADVIKTYVREGLGVGIIARMAFDPEADTGLELLDASHLFRPSTTRIGFRRGSYLRGFTYEFIQSFASHLDRDVVDTARGIRSHSSLDALFLDVDLPVR